MFSRNFNLPVMAFILAAAIGALTRSAALSTDMITSSPTPAGAASPLANTPNEAKAPDSTQDQAEAQTPVKASGKKHGSLKEITSNAELIKAEAAAKEGKAEGKTPVDYEYFEGLMNSIHAVDSNGAGKESEHLCGLDSYCVTLWKRGKLQVYKEGRILSGDFNFDGVPDDAFILEKERAEDVGKDYFISITTKDKGVGKVLMHQAIPDVQNIVEFTWDPALKALVIDTGLRQVRTKSISNVYGSGFKSETGQTFKSVALVRWDDKALKFALESPVYIPLKKGNK